MHIHVEVRGQSQVCSYWLTQSLLGWELHQVGLATGQQASKAPLISASLLSISGITRRCPFLRWFWEPNSGLHACKASIFPTKPSSQLQFLVLEITKWLKPKIKPLNLLSKCWPLLSHRKLKLYLGDCIATRKHFFANRASYTDSKRTFFIV